MGGSVDLEKKVDSVENLETKEVELNLHESLTEEEEKIRKKYLRKVDLRLVPILSLTYIMILIDAGNIGAVLFTDFIPALKLSKVQQGNIVSFYYITLIIFQLPSNVLLKKTRPRFWLSSISLLAGISAFLLTYAKNGNTAIALRILMGLFQAGYVPGVVGYFNYWYTRTEYAVRMSAFFTSVATAGIIGTPMTATLVSKKVMHFLSYQSVYFVEGLISIILAVLMFFILVDYPDRASFFTPEEKELIIRRLNKNQGMASHTKPTLKATLTVLADWKIYVNAIIVFGLHTISTIVGSFAPSLLVELGYEFTTAIYLATIQAGFGLLGILTSIQLMKRFEFSKLIIIYGIIGYTCYSVAAFANGKILRLVFISLSGFGGTGNIPIIYGWVAINQGGIYKNLVASAVIMSIGSISGVVVPRFFVPAYAPRYYTGQYLTVFSGVLSLILAAGMRVYFAKENKRRDENPEDVSHLSLEEQRALSDYHPNFRYRL
ncbi:hypothetical protein BB559_000069 [Furculomyces boomerangus]|uniref:Major facilitator superfamily (MFS) profile domain-containing protein n=3 Tax=Harpellales TaxID=61421 RepID=A0A2T9Z6J6_9FUNG|nr:hypothetical protein BB559_000069 [Furculomyces boomerangus]PVZ98951.1 hypothetical protein BB558_005046 [Smittium angustum]